MVLPRGFSRTFFGTNGTRRTSYSANRQVFDNSTEYGKSVRAQCRPKKWPGHWVGSTWTRMMCASHINAMKHPRRITRER